MELGYLHPREEIIEVMERIYHNGMTTVSGGNLSILDDDGSLWITPSGVDKGSLKPEDIIRVLPNGDIEGPHKPSSEYPFHLAIYQKRKDIRAVLHAHPPALVSFSIVRTIPNTNVIPGAHDVCGTVGYASYAIPGSDKLGENLANMFEKGHDTVLMENHGIATVGNSLIHAYQRLETLDFCARLIIKGRLMGNVRYLSDAQVALLTEKHKSPLQEYERDTLTSEEKLLRSEICKFLSRSYRRQLITSTQGTFSARVNENSFLITPFNVDRKYMDVDDLVLISNGKKEKGKTPSRSVRLHEEIYKTHPNINAILIAHPPNALSFGVCDAPFDTRTIPESYIVLKDIPLLPYGSQFLDMTRLMEALSTKNPVIICENDCIIATGSNLTVAFDRLEVAEYSAKAIINAKSLGEIVAISDEDTEEIKRVFLSE